MVDEKMNRPHRVWFHGRFWGKNASETSRNHLASRSSRLGRRMFAVGISVTPTSSSRMPIFPSCQTRIHIMNANFHRRKVAFTTAAPHLASRSIGRTRLIFAGFHRWKSPSSQHIRQVPCRSIANCDGSTSLDISRCRPFTKSRSNLHRCQSPTRMRRAIRHLCKVVVRCRKAYQTSHVT